MSTDMIGKWAFLIGLILAVIAGFITGYAQYIALVLFILGLVVGFLNVSGKDAQKFLISVVALLLLGVGSISALAVLGIVSTYVNSILGNFIAFVGAAGLVVAIKSVVETSKK